MDDSLRLRARMARAALTSGELRGSALLAALSAIPFTDRDTWLDELLELDPPPPDAPDLPRGAVPYLPCGVDEIVAMVRDAPVGAADHFVDLGAGLGRVAMLVHLLTDARASGIELQPALVERARQRSAALGLSALAFTCGDAGARALDGTVFFLYAPCNGPMYARVVDRLAEAARRRPIVIGCVGCELPILPWLVPRPTACTALALYDARG